VALVHWKTIVSIAPEAEWTLQNMPLIHVHYCWVLILDTPLFLLITLTLSYLLNFRLQSSCVSTLLVPAHQQGSWTYQIISNRSCGWKLLCYCFIAEVLSSGCISELFWLILQGICIPILFAYPYMTYLSEPGLSIVLNIASVIKNNLGVSILQSHFRILVTSKLP
jgi:hypothetical protein